VKFLGYQSPDALWDRLQGTWVQVCPSRWREPFGNVIVEAMLRGIPVVASNEGGPAEIIEHQKTGWLVKPRSVEALGDALAQSVQSLSVTQEMGRNARRAALRSYTLDRFTESVLAVYRECLS
jgi:glycosyltransferase involved in cell wall biosynthesis